MMPTPPLPLVVVVLVVEPSPWMTSLAGEKKPNLGMPDMHTDVDVEIPLEARPGGAAQAAETDGEGFVLEHALLLLLPS